MAEQEREALAEVLAREFWKPDNGGQWARITDAVLASDWLASRDAALIAEAKAEALREAADQWIDGGLITTDKLRRFLLDRADHITPTPKGGPS